MKHFYCPCNPGDLVEMAKNKYAKNFIKRIMDRGTKEQREVIMASFSSHVPELVSYQY